MAHYLIIGQGIAGTVLAYTLLQRGHQVQIIDNDQPQTASKVAAGLFNPVTGYRMVKTWLADQLFPFLQAFYPALEAYLEAKFFYPLPMYRPFESVAQQNEVLAEISDEKFAAYVEKTFFPNEYGKKIKDPFGGVLLKKSGYVNLPVMLSAARKKWQADNILHNATFSEAQVELDKEKVHYQGMAVDYLVLCRGWQETQSSWFALPFRPVKGEILQVRFTDETYGHIINRSCWILPQPDQSYRIGATYYPQDVSLEPSLKGRQELTAKLHSLTGAKWEIMGHLAGVRPATFDRRPFIGLHPVYRRVCIFNGLGSKGVSLAPYFAAVLADFLEGKTQFLPKEVDIARCGRI
ncbi:MAG: FAD-dependent oxidoreductase [Cytophagales bacterium]|nr:FAD-binding oxidoreductase [Bernardetiaceae bacterium]MDW8210253.1 FAD-dependent oxidoreductase [Cytophagales bacterium]